MSRIEATDGQMNIFGVFYIIGTFPFVYLGMFFVWCVLNILLGIIVFFVFERKDKLAILDELVEKEMIK